MKKSRIVFATLVISAFYAQSSNAACPRGCILDHHKAEIARIVLQHKHCPPEIIIGKLEAWELAQSPRFHVYELTQLTGMMDMISIYSSEASPNPLITADCNISEPLK